MSLREPASQIFDSDHTARKYAPVECRSRTRRIGEWQFAVQTIPNPSEPEASDVSFRIASVFARAVNAGLRVPSERSSP